MKKYHFLICFALLNFFISCEEETIEKPTTFTIVNNMESNFPDIEFLDGSFYESKIVYFVDQRINGDEMQIGTLKPLGGSTDTILVKNDANSLILSFNFLPKESALYWHEKNVWANHLKVLELGTHNEIVIDESSLIVHSTDDSSFCTTASEVFIELHDALTH